MNNKKSLTADQCQQLLTTLKSRFETRLELHQGVNWGKVQEKLMAQQGKLWALSEMERTGGEPTVVGSIPNGPFRFIDCSIESPSGRRSLCFDEKALASRKEHKPATSAMAMAAGMGIRLLTEEEYRELQTFGKFDLKTSSWVQTPEKIRNLGGALFCDRRYDHVFTYHNGAESYYAARGFRGVVTV